MYHLFTQVYKYGSQAIQQCTFECLFIKMINDKFIIQKSLVYRSTIVLHLFFYCSTNCFTFTLTYKTLREKLKRKAKFTIMEITVALACSLSCQICLVQFSFYLTCFYTCINLLSVFLEPLQRQGYLSRKLSLKELRKFIIHSLRYKKSYNWLRINATE